jgi:hypothetical protein
MAIKGIGTGLGHAGMASGREALDLPLSGRRLGGQAAGSTASAFGRAVLPTRAGLDGGSMGVMAAIPSRTASATNARPLSDPMRSGPPRSGVGRAQGFETPGRGEPAPPDGQGQPPEA